MWKDKIMGSPDGVFFKLSTQRITIHMQSELSGQLCNFWFYGKVHIIEHFNPEHIM